jgi:hypothetical protein
MPNDRTEKGPVVDTGAQRGAAKHPSEIVNHTGNSHNMIGALGNAKILPGIIMGCETIDINGQPFTLIVRINPGEPRILVLYGPWHFFLLFSLK